MAKAIRAGCPEIRKVMRMFPGFSLIPCRGGGHANMVSPAGELVRRPDGRKLTVVCSPRDGDRAAADLVRALTSIGIDPRR